MNRCEYGKDDYSLSVANLPVAPLVNEGVDTVALRNQVFQKNLVSDATPDDATALQIGLFDGEEAADE